VQSWPAAEPPLAFDRHLLERNLDCVRRRLVADEVDALLVTSGDRWLNEYTPRADNHRFLLSGFTGSTGLLILPVTGRAQLFVDGRYHLQADEEALPDLIEVVKLRFGSQLQGSVLEALAKWDRIAYEADRVASSFAEQIEALGATKAYCEGEIATCLDKSPAPLDRLLELIPPEISGRDGAAKIAAVREQLGDSEASFLLAALDDIAWLTDLRGYHFPHQSSFAAEGLLEGDRLHLCVAPELLREGPPKTADHLVWHAKPLAQLLAERPGEGEGERYRWDARTTNAALVASLRRARAAADLAPAAKNPVVAARAIKTAAELAHFESMNARSSAVIAETFRWLRAEIAAGRKVTELDFRDRANAHYAQAGARDLSFTTIAAAGPSSAIIHFSASSAERIIGANDLVLLDSGAYYEGGFATDITRTAIAGGRLAEPSPRQREIYTLVLKGLLRGMSAICPEGAPGAFFDAIAREPIYAGGYDYAHGTGHGVGIHVHEAGVGFAPLSGLTLRAGQVSSIEPGIYLEGFGGVRLENVVAFEAIPDRPGFLRNRPLNFVDYDEYLIDLARLDEAERDACARYRERCRRDGTLLEG
jgi:Xaa-Pro aminopeptidase